MCAILLLGTGLVGLSAPAVHFYYHAAFFAGILLAWRFRSSRILFVLVTLLLAYQAIEFFSPGHPVSSGSGRIAFEAVDFLIPLNFIFVAFVRERGFAISAIASRVALLFFESVFVAVICRPGERTGPALIQGPIFGLGRFHWSTVPQPGLVMFAVAFGVLLVRFLIYRKPLEGGLLWSAAAAFMGLQSRGISQAGTAYFATSGLILISSIIENTYALAYHDELTGLPSRRAFNEALQGLVEPYSIAVVDIDHFKNFNDTYGHETGDQVLRLVAGRLAAVGGGGRAYRVGGEEFSILFPGKPMKEVLDHLEMLRASIETSSFRLRSAPERRAEARGPDRRNVPKKSVSKKAASKKFLETGVSELSVTVSIGVAEPTSKAAEAEQVIHLADKALYRAKHAGRNRVEASRTARSRSSRGAGRSIA